MTAIGVDWGSGYWVGVELDDCVSVEAFPSILNLWHKHSDHADRILIDIPIGLPSTDTDVDDGWRLCDREAREKLSSTLASSVFLTPCRKAIYADNYDQARDRNQEVLNRGLGSQSWSLIPRIQEVDVFLRNSQIDVANSRTEFRESHPEVCFAGLADLSDVDTEVTERKTTDKGIKQRKKVLREYEPKLVDKYEDIENCLADDQQYTAWKHRITSTRLDDVLDAMALAATADQHENNLDSLPASRDTPPEDEHCLPMEIVRPRDQS